MDERDDMQQEDAPAAVAVAAPETAAAEEGARAPHRKERVGVVTSNKMDKTITVSVAGVVHHRLYKKGMKRTKKFKAHDESNQCEIGDTVRIQETRPLSKTKRWQLIEIIKKHD